MFRFTTKDVWTARQVKQFKIVEHPGASATLVVEDDKVLMVEQYRPAAGRYMLELPAGTREHNETPVECARRELEEETGYQAQDWTAMGVIYPTPGYTSEVLHLFYAEGLTKSEQRLDEGEDLVVRWVPLSEVEAMIEEGKICDAKTIVAFFKYLKRLATR